MVEGKNQPVVHVKFVPAPDVPPEEPDIEDEQRNPPEHRENPVERAIGRTDVSVLHDEVDSDENELDKRESEEEPQPELGGARNACILGQLFELLFSLSPVEFPVEKVQEALSDLDYDLREPVLVSGQKGVLLELGKFLLKIVSPPRALVALPRPVSPRDIFLENLIQLFVLFIRLAQSFQIQVNILLEKVYLSPVEVVGELEL